MFKSWLLLVILPPQEIYLTFWVPIYVIYKGGVIIFQNCSEDEMSMYVKHIEWYLVM